MPPLVEKTAYRVFLIKCVYGGIEVKSKLDSESQPPGGRKSRMRLRLAVAVFALAMVLPACRESPSGLVVGTGTTHPSGVECSAWFVHADAGHEYQLIKLAPEFQQAGLRVRFMLRRRNDLASICMAGEIADVVSMTRS